MTELMWWIECELSVTKGSWKLITLRAQKGSFIISAFS